METWQDVKDFFFPALQDTETGQRFFTTTQALAWANAGLWELGQHAQYYDLVETQNTADADAAYFYGPDGLPPYGLWRVEIDDEAIRPTTIEMVTGLDRTWESRTGQPGFYYLNDSLEAMDHSQISLWEKPDGIYELRTYAYGVPAQVSDSADTDSLQVPQWAIYGVLWYMLSEAFLADTRRQSLDASGFYRMLYDDTLERLQDRANSRLNKRWVVAGEGHKFDKGFWSNLPDTITGP